MHSIVSNFKATWTRIAHRPHPDTRDDFGDLLTVAMQTRPRRIGKAQ